MPAAAAGIDHPTRVVKTLRPQQPGAQRWQTRFGEQLVCVRYREDPAARQRYITVELLVDVKPIRAAARPRATGSAGGSARTGNRATSTENHAEDLTRFVHVRIDPSEDTLRQRAFAAGATCHPRQPIWRMPLATARALRLLRRIIDERP